jgi:hypothetical protein
VYYEFLHDQAGKREYVYICMYIHIYVCILGSWIVVDKVYYDFLHVQAGKKNEIFFHM